MRRRIRWQVVVFALALPGVTTVGAQVAGVADPAPAGDVGASAGTARGEAAAPSRRGGLVGAVLEWFRGGEDEEAVAPAPGSVLAAVPEPEPVLPPGPTATPEPAAEPETAGEPEPVAATAPGAEPAHGRQRTEGGEAVTLADAWRATRDLVAEIEVLRRAQGVTDAPAAVGPGEGRAAPIHAFLESLEVMEKAARVQRRFGMIPFVVAPMPAGDVTAGDIHRNVATVIEELRRVKRQLVIEARIEPAPPEAGDPTPERLHTRLAGASALLDGLVGRAVSSNDVYMHVRRVRAAMAPLAARLGVTLAPDPSGPQVPRESRASKEVAQQILIATYKAVHLQSRLGMAPSDVPGAPTGEATPADVYEAVNRLLVELARIGTHLGVETLIPEREETRRMRGADVHAQALRLIADLDRVSRAVAGAG